MMKSNCVEFNHTGVKSSSKQMEEFLLRGIAISARLRCSGFFHVFFLCEGGGVVKAKKKQNQK